MGFPSGAVVKNPPADAGDARTQETWVRSLSQEDPLEKDMATHSSILAWRTLWTEEPGRLLSLGLQRVGHDYEAYLAHMHTFLSRKGIVNNKVLRLLNTLIYKVLRTLLVSICLMSLSYVLITIY